MYDVERLAAKYIIKVLVRNKKDLKSERKVSYEDGEEMGKRYHMMYIEIYAKTGVNIFRIIGKDMQQFDNLILNTPKERSIGTSLRTGKRWCC